ncbi:MAG: hypothetical protein HYY09_00520 [Firmicutes bacterium]|nr:hypothetical protein [Bacillota bacterium]
MIPILIGLLLAALVGAAATHLFLPAWSSLLGPSRRVINYRGHGVEPSAGLALLVSVMVTAVIFSLGGLAGIDGAVAHPVPDARPAGGISLPPPFYGFIFLLTLAALAGFIDDQLGSRSARGLKGHLGSLVRGYGVTTGGLKAVALGAGGLVASASLDPATPGVLLLHAIVIALSANGFNLLDLRPGRAVKFFLVLAVLPALAWSLLGAASTGETAAFWLAPLAGGAMAYLPRDLGEKAMLGDTVSNLLGAAAGWTAAQLLPVPWELSLLAFLLVIHLVAEKYSLGEIIEKSPFLRAFDSLGRRGRPASERTAESSVENRHGCETSSNLKDAQP